MSRHSTLASASARRIAMAPISIAETPGKRPNGCSPTPMIATSIRYPLWVLVDRPECEGDDLVALVVGAERNQHELHLHAVAEPLRVGLGQARLDLHLARELDVADPERRESLAALAQERRRRGRKALRGPRPQATAPSEQL